MKPLLCTVAVALILTTAVQADPPGRARPVPPGNAKPVPILFPPQATRPAPAPVVTPKPPTVLPTAAVPPATKGKPVVSGTTPTGRGKPVLPGSDRAAAPPSRMAPVTMSTTSTTRPVMPGRPSASALAPSVASKSPAGAKVLANSTSFKSPMPNYYDPFGDNRRNAYLIGLYGHAWSDNWAPWLFWDPYPSVWNFGPVISVEP